MPGFVSSLGGLPVLELELLLLGGHRPEGRRVGRPEEPLPGRRVGRPD